MPTRCLEKSTTHQQSLCTEEVRTRNGRMFEGSESGGITTIALALRAKLVYLRIKRVKVNLRTSPEQNKLKQEITTANR